MDLELRLAALANLVSIKTDEVERRLLDELNRVETVLQNDTDYEALSAALKTLAVLSPRFHARVIPILGDFVRSVPARALTYGGEPVPESRHRYWSVSHLIRESIDVPRSVRFVHMEQYLELLFHLWGSDDVDVRGKADRTLEGLAEFDLNIFYGERGVGALPQAQIVKYLAKFENEQLLLRADVILKMLRKVLAPSIEGHTWTYSSVNIRRGGIPAGGGVAEMRADAIGLLKRMFNLDDGLDYRKRVLNVLGTAMRRDSPVSNADAAAMFDRDVLDVLRFLRDRVAVETLPLIQTIERDAYWNYHHATSTQIENAALEVRNAIAQRPDYSIYRQLIGFEGVHGVWEDLKRSGKAWNFNDDERKNAAAQYVEDINDSNYAVWRDRILEFSKTRSDDMATFPVYYEFLRAIGQKRPGLALDLVQNHQDVMAPFLIALLRGLWSSESKAETEAVAQKWLADHRHLAGLAKSLNVDDQPRLDLLIRVIQEADKSDDTNAIIEAMGVAARQYANGFADAKDAFLQGMRALSKRRNAHWANVSWFSRDIQKLVEAMEPAERDEVLESMEPLPALTYQAEEILFSIGQRDPQALLNHLMVRVRMELACAQHAQQDDSDLDLAVRFEAIPDSLHSLDKLLSNMPEKLLLAVRMEFKTENVGIFQFSSAARLIVAVFPAFEQPLQDQLLSYVQRENLADTEFVVAILRAYSGKDAILPICKEVVKVVPERSDAWSEIAAAIETTGVVYGESGVVNAYEAKRDEIAHWMNEENSRVRAFAAWLIEGLDQMIVQERQRTEESIALRKHKYGAGDDEA